MIEISLNLAAAKSSSVVSNIGKNNNQFEPEIVSLLLHLFRKNHDGLFVDVGSNIGFFPLIIAKVNDQTGSKIEICAHEPLPELQKVSKALQTANGVTYKLESTAASDYTGTADFFVSAVSDSSNSLVAGFRKAKGVISVTVDTIDNIYLEKVKRGPSGEVVLMVDVETAEPAVLRGARTLMRECRPLIVCEVLAGRTEKDISPILKEVNYITYRFDGEKWTLEKALRGDRTYKHRDWFFAPAERQAEFGESFFVPANHVATFMLR